MSVAETGVVHGCPGRRLPPGVRATSSERTRAVFASFRSAPTNPPLDALRYGVRDTLPIPQHATSDSLRPAPSPTLSRSLSDPGTQAPPPSPYGRVMGVAGDMLFALTEAVSR